MNILSVSDLTSSIRKTLESRFSRVIVEGEVAGFKRHSSGHCYFSLKDSNARLQCVVYRSDVRRLQFNPSDGMLVHAAGQISVYPPRGEYQLITRSLRPAGEGALRKAFEALKRQLAAEGLFDTSRKLPIPTWPTVVGIVTSRDGAALRDILNVLERRYPAVRVILKPVPVQGPSAANRIASAIRAFNRSAASGGIAADVLIVGRGGGSEEDLWAFNEEVVARAISASTIPIVSAVGHETDVSIADFVADLRAPTPSAAAELVVPDRRALEQQVSRLAGRLTMSASNAVRLRKQRILALLRSHAFNEPRTRLRFLNQRLDELGVRMGTSVVNRLARTRVSIEALKSRLDSLDPRIPLERGFAIVESTDGPVTRAAQLSEGDHVEIRFHDGRRPADITG